MKNEILLSFQDFEIIKSSTIKSKTEYGTIFNFDENSYITPLNLNEYLSAFNGEIEIDLSLSVGRSIQDYDERRKVRVHLNIKSLDLDLFKTSNALRNYSGSIENPNVISKVSFDVLVNDYLPGSTSTLSTVDALKLITPGFNESMIVSGVSIGNFVILKDSGTNEKQTILIKIIKGSESTIVKVYIGLKEINDANVLAVTSSFVSLNNPS
jgi:hypothetical protein